MFKPTLEELQSASDVDLGTSAPMTIDQERILQFADATEDHQWIHVDPERAKNGPYGTTIAHGFLVLSLIPKLFWQLIDLGDLVVVNYGVDKLRFIQPVPTGAEIELRAKLASGQKRLGGALCRVRCGVHLCATGKRAVTAELLLLILPQKSAPAPDAGDTA